MGVETQNQTRALQVQPTEVFAFPVSRYAYRGHSNIPTRRRAGLLFFTRCNNILHTKVMRQKHLPAKVCHKFGVRKGAGFIFPYVALNLTKK